MTATMERRLASDALEAQTERRARLGLPSGPPSQTSIGNALAGWMLAKATPEAELSYAQKAGLKECGVRDHAEEFAIELHSSERCREIKNAMSTTDTGGGYLVPQGTLDRIEQALADASALRALGETIRVPHGGFETLPVVDDATGVGELLEENFELTSEDFTLGALSPGFRRFTSKMLKMSDELFTDSILTAERIMTMLSARVARKQNQFWTTDRVVPAIATGVTCASSTAVTYDELVALLFAVDEAYRDSPTAAWMMHSDTAKAMLKIKDSGGHPIFKMGQNSTGWLLGKRVRTNASWPTIATGVKAIAFGDWFAGLKIVDVREIRMRQANERYAELDQTGFMAILKSGCAVQTAGSPLLALTMA